MKKILIVGLILCGVGVFAASDEITVTALLKVDNGNFSLTRNVSNLRRDQAGTASDYGIQELTTATNLLNISNVSTPHYAFFRSLGTNNTSAVFVTLTLKLLPGDIAVLPVLSTNMTSYVTNGTSSIEYWVNEL